MNENDNRSEYVIVYMALAASGFLIGLICGWLFL